MRITGGLYGGRVLQSPKDSAIRPTSDKVRQAVFNILCGRGLVNEAVVLDAFCGTGALGLEAISRGALCCTFIDKNRSSLDLCRQNYAALKVSAKCSFFLKDAAKPGERPRDAVAANLVFLDPPYAKGLVQQSLTGLGEAGWMADDAAILIESETGFNPEALENVDIVLVRDYGDTRITLAQRRIAG